MKGHDMAWSFNAAISNSNLTPTQRFVAIQISSFVNEHGDMTAFPSVKTLCRITGYGRRTIQRAISDLVDAGYIEVKRQFNGCEGQTVNLYRLISGDISSKEAAPERHEGVSEVRPPAPHDRPELSIELSIEKKDIYRSSDKSVTGKETDIAGFNRFWAAYPRKVGKPAAEKAWRKAIRSAPVETIMAGLSKYIAERQRDSRSKEDMIKFTAHPATWLNQERWNDVAETFDDASF